MHIGNTQIKICGLTLEKEAEYLNEFKVDYAGFVFFEKSKRNISFEQAEKIFRVLNPGIKKVAVTVSPDVEMIKRLNSSGFDIIQIHGNIGKETIGLSEKPIWRAVNIKDGDGLAVIAECLETETKNEEPADLRSTVSGYIEGILADAPDFGSGKCFDWRSVKENLHMDRRWRNMKFILAGGLNSGNVREGIRIFSPDIVDVSTGVEGEKGKDRQKIKEFVTAVRE